MNFEQERKHLRLVKQIQPRPPSLLFHKLKPLVPLSEVHLVPTAPDRYAHLRLHQERLNKIRASAESLHGHQVNRTLSLSPTTCCRDEKQCFWSAALYLVEASKVVFQFEVFFGARMGISPGSPGPKSRTQSDVSEADTTKADLSSSDCSLGISCAAVFSIARHFSRRTSSPIFPRSDGGVPLHCDDYRTAVHSLSLLETGERSPAPSLTRL